MKNLKRIFSLALAGTMLAGMLTIGASAAEFSDDDKIVNQNAVDTMVALSVISGKPDGSFDPEATVTRAEMAKMITIALNGGKDPVLGTKATPTYTDIKGHWAEKYIEYCSSLGIISGRGNGIFDPAGTVTGTEAAKMMLVAMGYDSTVFKFTGADWALNVNIEANNATPYKLYEEIESIDPNAGLTRDNAAQLIFNGVQDYVMEKSPSLTITNGEIQYNYYKADGTQGGVTKTILSEKYGAKVWLGTFEGNNNFATTTVPEGEIAVKGGIDTIPDNGGNYAKFPSDLSIEYIGEEVKVIYKDGKGGQTGPDKKDTIYGVFVTGNSDVVKVTRSEVSALKSAKQIIKVDGTEYDVDDNVKVYTDFVATSVQDSDDFTLVGSSSTTSGLTDLLRGATQKGQSADLVKLVLNNGKVSNIYISTLNIGRVTNVTATKVTINGLGGITIADHDVYEDIAKDDVVVYTRYYDNSDLEKAFVTVTKAETVEGTITGFKKDASDSNKLVNVVVDGTTYKINNKPATIPTHTDDAVTDFGNATTNIIGDEVRLYLVGGLVGAVQSLEVADTNWAMVIDADVSGTGRLTSTINPAKVSVLFADGTEGTMAIHKDSKDGNATLNLTNVKAGNLVKYSLSGDKIKIAEVLAYDGNTVGSDTVIYNKDSKIVTFGTNKANVAAAEAVLFVAVNADDADGSLSAANKFYAYSLRDLGKITASEDTHVNAALNGKNQVEVAVVTLTERPKSASSTTLYGIVNGYAGVRKSGDDTYNGYTIYVDGEEESIVVYTLDTLTTGEVVKFDQTKDNVYDHDAIVSVETNAAEVVTLAVDGYNADKNLLTGFIGTTQSGNVWVGSTAKPGSYTIDKDAKIIYVDKTNNKTGSEIGINTFDSYTGKANVKIIDTDSVSDKVYDLVIVETTDAGFPTIGFAGKVS